MRRANIPAHRDGTHGKRCRLTCYILSSLDKHVLNVLNIVGISPGSPPWASFLGGFQLHRRVKVQS